MKIEPFYVQQEREIIEKMSLVELFDSVIDAQSPDDWDGGWTGRGWRLKTLYETEFRTRLEKLEILIKELEK